MPVARYGPRKLWRIWLANGGSKKQAATAVAVALAESRGNPNARHVNTNGTIDQGLWQINSSNYSGSDIYDPNVNARWAIRLSTHGRGWKNWTTFTSGAYKKFLPKRGVQTGDTQVPGHRKGFGIFTQGNYAGTDQGVDFSGSGPIPALASGVVTDVGRSSIIEGGTYPYVIYRLTSGPFKGHFVYVAENFAPTVKKGTKLKVGQSIGRAVGSFPYIEVGFNKTAQGWNPVAPLNPNPHSPKPAGNAMWSYIQGVAGLHPGGVVSGAAGLGGDISGAATGAYKGVTGAGSAALSAITGGAGDALKTVTQPIADELDKIGHWFLYAGAIAGGGFTFILGFVLIAADVGLSSRAGKVAAAVPAGRYIARGARASTRTSSAGTRTSRAKSNVPSREEERREEMHQARLQKTRAQTKATKSQAKNRRRTASEQKEKEKKAYYAGARDAASPTMAKIRRERGKRKST